MNSFKLLATLLVLYFSFSVTTYAADGESQTLRYEKSGSTFSAEYKDGEILKLVRNNKVVYRSSRSTKLGSVKKQLKSLTKNINKLMSLDKKQNNSSSDERKSLEDKVINQMNKVTIRLSRK